MLSPWRYHHLARPRERREDAHPDGTNCRTLIQDYFLDQHNRFLTRDDVEQPGLWQCTGGFLPLTGSHDVTRLAALPHEAILLADRIRVTPTELADPPAPESLLRLHTAPLLREIPPIALPPGLPSRGDLTQRPVVLHATALDAGTCLWDIVAFAARYRLVAAKRL